MALEAIKQQRPVEAAAKGEAVAAVSPPAAANADNSTNNNTKKSTSGKSSEPGVRQRKRKPLTKQQRMLLQMKAQQKLERAQQEEEEAQTNRALSSLLVKYLQAMSLVLLMAAVLLYTYAPGLVHKWFSRKPRLPTRSLVAVYPPSVALRRDLPRFFMQYSLATADNLATRQAVQHAQKLRVGATQTGSIYQQTINLWPWEVAQFRRQFSQKVPMDAYCGTGTEAIFSNRPELREEILIWCLLATGHDDGMLRFGVQTVHGSLARGLQGVAVRYDGQPQRVHSQSLLLLPLLDPASLAEGKEMAPSTKVALHAMSWLRQNAALIANVDELVQGLEEYMYFVIRKEDATSWHWMQAACTVEERQTHVEAGDLRVATLCTEGQEEEGADCCVVYDPHWRDFFVRSKPRVALSAPDEEDKDEN
jgi:hypothetical protein